MRVATEQARSSCNQNHGRVLGVYSDGEMRYVATQGAIGDWAAYSLHEPTTDDAVQRNGNKMYDAHAFELFPWLNKEGWRD